MYGTSWKHGSLRKMPRSKTLGLLTAGCRRRMRIALRVAFEVEVKVIHTSTPRKRNQLPCQDVKVS